MLGIVLVIFLYVSLVPELLVASELVVSEGSNIDEIGAQEIKTTFHIFPSYFILGAQHDMVDQEIAASGQFYGIVGAGGGGVVGAAGGAGAVVLGGKIFSVTVSNTAIMLGAAGGGIVGLGAGMWLGGEYGKAVGEAHAKELLKKNIDWIQTPYLDVAFHTTRGDETLYDLTVKLRPTSGGWRNCEADADVAFTSAVQMKWLVGGTKNDGSELFITRCNTYNSVFGQGDVRRLKRNLSYPEHTGRFFCPEDDHVHLPYSQMHVEELFRGRLPNPVSIFDIANSIEQLQAGGRFPLCSNSGKMKTNSKGVNEDVINPAVFTCRLLNNLGVAIGDTSLERFLSVNRSGTLITRDAIISEMYANAGPLGLESNMQLLQDKFSHTIS